MTKIKDASIIILIVFIIASILYGIHMFRYEFIQVHHNQSIIRYDRITNTQCLSMFVDVKTSFRDGLKVITKDAEGELDSTRIFPCKSINPSS